MVQMSAWPTEQDCKKRTKSPPERFPGRHAIKILELLDEMGLVVVAAVVKQLVLTEALLRGFGTKDILKTDDLAERFGGVADIIFEKPAKLAGAKPGVEVLFDIQHAEILKNHGQCPVQTRIVVEINTCYPMQEVVVEPALDLRQRQSRPPKAEAMNAAVPGITASRFSKRLLSSDALILKSCGNIVGRKRMPT